MYNIILIIADETIKKHSTNSETINNTKTHIALKNNISQCLNGNKKPLNFRIKNLLEFKANYKKLKINTLKSLHL